MMLCYTTLAKLNFSIELNTRADLQPASTACTKSN